MDAWAFLATHLVDSHSISGPPVTQELHSYLLGVHFECYQVLFDARTTNSSTLESKSLRIGDLFDFL